MISVVGLGPGHTDYITSAVLKRIQRADVLIGGSRQLQLFKDVSCKKILFTNQLDLSYALNHPGNVVVLASGEPGLYGILDKVLEYRKREEIEVIPGVSSVQYMMAKLAMSMKGMAVVSLHGRNQDLELKIMQHKTIAVLTDRQHNPQYIARKLQQEGILDVHIYVGQNLSYENETIESFSVKELSESTKDFNLNVVVITGCGNTDSAFPMSFL